MRATLLAILIAQLAASCCPPLRESYASPEDTLLSWQSHLCHDDAQGEYRALSGGLQRQMFGFETYIAARRKMLDEEPLIAFLLKRVDLPGRVVERSVSEDGAAVDLVFEESGQRFSIRFVVETQVIATTESGEQVPGRLDGPLPFYFGQDRRRQWVNLPAPRLNDEEREGLRSLLLEQRWKIDNIQGLTALPEPAASGPTASCLRVIH